MKLAEYLLNEGIKRGDFARAIGVSPGWITQLCDGTGWPSQDVADKIRASTRGRVTADDFLPPAQPNGQRDPGAEGEGHSHAEGVTGQDSGAALHETSGAGA